MSSTSKPITPSEPPSENSSSSSSSSNTTITSPTVSSSSSTSSTFTQEELKKATAYLASSKSNIRLRQSVLNGHRVTYCKGKHALSAFQSHPTYNIHANVLLETLIIEGFMIRVEKIPKQRRLMAFSIQSLDLTDYYVLRHEPNAFFLTLGAVALVLVVLAAVMFPLWPNVMKSSVVYVSYTLLGLLGIIFVLAIVRVLIFVPLWFLGRPGWLFPNLFADAGIVESFMPVWAWDEQSTTSSLSKKKD
ncbi:Translocation protein S62 [Coelomomyces lativittatus]|nr:Translocation protein S62 [Coelomomyces lativittatus]KAJ1514388.1 Translocation protein S62 [Coelomomyces lativittatus]KAJ1517927.1 Translocation protein S62 [Coelomomyces lativittatus]